jgi:death-on-curing protein
MQIDDPGLAEEYQRWAAKIGDSDPYKGNSTVGILDVLRAHFLILDFFSATGREGFGGIGPRDLTLLHSAVSRQLVSFEGKPKYLDGLDQCATLFFGIINNHAFHDANKRTALLVALYHLSIIGRCPDEHLKQKELDLLAVNTAEHKLNEYQNYPKFLRRYGNDADVFFLSDWFRRHTRKIDLSSYTITFNELDRVLRRFGCRLANPSGNYIDVMRTRQETYTEYLIFKKTRPVEKRVAQVGFPGWKKQVNPGAIKTIRKECELTPAQGIDSQVFFKGADNMEALIDKFSGPLRRLANK